LERERFREEVDGKPVDLYTLRNAHGMVVRITNWGARVLQILVPDRAGAPGDVALGYDSLAQLRQGQASMGAFIGRYANRIGGARFVLDGIEYRLAANSGPNTLHGGAKGSRFQVFDARQPDGATVVMTYTFRDGEENFPGTLPVRVTYSVTNGNELVMAYDADAVDRNTVANFTGHAFFNLGGHASGSILGHVLEVPASRFLPVDATSVPTGEMRPVQGTPMDFRRPVAIGARIGQEDEQLKLGSGYDHHYVLDKRDGELTMAARVREPESGRVMEVWSTEPGLQVYSGNFLEGKAPRDIGKKGAVYGFRSAFCLEPSHFPDSVNRPEFPSTVIRAGERYSGKTAYRFSAL
jgi:aldose 1-epimerase